jgi:DNA-binding response OmpR family regulator
MAGMTTRILVVEDDPDIAELVDRYLTKAGFVTDRVSSGRDALDAIAAKAPDLLVLDLMLPHLDGLEICRRVRANEQSANIPIIMLTARAEESERIVGLELGADDYLAKPFSPNELVARVRALLRRANRTAPVAKTLAYGSIAVDTERHIVSLDGETVTLTAKEFLLLEYLLQHKGRVLSRDLLLTDVWGYRYTGGTRTVDVHVRRLREKLPLLAEAIVTVKQFGYKLLIRNHRHESRAHVQTQFFVAALTATILALGVAGILFSGTMRRQVDDQIESTLVAETRLAAELLSRTTPLPTIPEIQDEAIRIGELLSARVTFIAEDGRVVGDSFEQLSDLASMENHAQRPEVVDARTSGLGRSRRSSASVKMDMLYAAVPVKHPIIAFVRVAVPLTDVGHQVQTVLTATGTALGLALVGAAAIAWLFSIRISQRVRIIAQVAQRYESGDLTPPRLGFGDDELGTVRARSISPCKKSGAGSRSRRAIARAWKRFSPAWSRASSSSTPRDGCSS